jgi:sigma-E factor negative regulatory protein RseA
MRQTSASSLAVPQPAPQAAEQILCAVSAMLDDEISEGELGTLLDEAQNGGDAFQAWHRYLVIGDALRAVDSPSAALARSASTPDSLAFARRVVERAQADAQADAVHSPVSARPHVAGQGVDAPAQAANDPVFRWKAVAALASLSAVLSMAWHLSGAPRGGVELAAAPVPAPAQPAVVVARAMPDPQSVWVSTPQGQVLRDARIEELMQAHRQLGGASALQVPAGFLRNATFDTAQR